MSGSFSPVLCDSIIVLLTFSKIDHLLSVLHITKNNTINTSFSFCLYQHTNKNIKVEFGSWKVVRTKNVKENDKISKKIKYK